MKKFESYTKVSGSKWFKTKEKYFPHEFYRKCDKYENSMKLFNVYEGEEWKLEWMKEDDKK